MLPVFILIDLSFSDHVTSSIANEMSILKEFK